MTILKRITRELKESDFYRNIMGLFSGVFAARLIPAIFALPIARLYAPEEFGDFVLFLSIASLVSIFSNGGYEGALLLAGNNRERKEVFSLGLKINLLINLTLLAGIIFSLPLFPTRNPYPALLVMVPFQAFFFGAIQLIRNSFISLRLFRQLALLEIFRAVATGILQLLFFIVPSTGLFLGVVLAQMVTFGAFVFRLPGRAPGSLFRKKREKEQEEIAAESRLKKLFSREERNLARRYSNFPRFSVPSEFFNFLSNQLPVFMIKPFFGPTMLGLYSFSHRYISIPVQLTSISIGSVYIQKARSLQENPRQLADITFDLFRKQVWLGVIPFTILGLWGRELFSFLFGNEWEFAGTLASLLAPWLFFVFTGSPLSTILIAKEKQKISMIFNILLLLFRAGVLLTGGLLIKTLAPVIALYSLTGFLFFGFLTFYSLFLAGVPLLKALAFLSKAAIITITPLIILWLWL